MRASERHVPSTGMVSPPKARETDIEKQRVPSTELSVRPRADITDTPFFIDLSLVTARTALTGTAKEMKTCHFNYADSA
ncbi:hypothetical protein EVAR_91975_1 [Eumeta japonica]|uniref:Uncharacterized protein n=1 Tax=Eumeta variegata TaxID=151549 RepID=A0A4C1ZZF9_EUMVA|nr:hypothetical protein EVAR_91975_1 [Eumeta japonica]